jgi:hypothetical protein
MSTLASAIGGDMVEAEPVQGLRSRLRAQLRKTVGQPAVEAKELAAFDLLMSRREFLKASQYTAIAGLIAAGTPPTLWGRRDRDLHVDPADVGLTVADQASATTATQVTVGTELFEEPVYAQPVISPLEPGSHALLEGAQRTQKLQSLFDSTAPQEQAFLDTGRHYGPTELIQLEQDTNANGDPIWNLVHYHYPWDGRSDGATTDGLVRDVIMGPRTSETGPGAIGLVSPTQVLAIMDPQSNRFDGAAASFVTYLVVVIDPGAGNIVGDGWFLVTNAGFSADATAGARQPYRLSPWKAMELNWFADNPDVVRATKHTDMGFGNVSPTDPTPAPPNESIVIYSTSGIHILSVGQGQGTGTLLSRTYGYPTAVGAAGWGLAHVDTRPTFVSTTVSTSGSTSTLSVTTAQSNNIAAAPADDFPLGFADLYVRKESYVGPDVQSYENALTLQGGEQVPTFAGVSDAYALYSVKDDSGASYHVHIARFGPWVGLYTIADTLYGQLLTGMVPLTMPDDGSGSPAPVTFSGGISKFGGFRFVLTTAAESAEGGSLFILRQQRYTPSDPDDAKPYEPAIYGPYDASGDVRVTGYATTTRDATPPSVDSTVANTVATWVRDTNQNTLTGATTGNTGSEDAAYNVMLNAVAAFANPLSPTVQGTWLGTGFQAAYAPSRFGFDSAHVAVTKSQSADATTDTYTAYSMFSNPVTKTWHQRQIASQVLPQPPGLNESGDHYQATVAGANVYGRPVSLALGDNADLLIEVRADAPTTVVDDTHNLYYDIDRDTSFMAAPDAASGRLGLVVRAETFAQVLYVRLIDPAGLQPSGGDPALWTSSGVTTYAWQTVNMAAQAQQRMGNDGTTTIVDLLGDDAPVPDTTQYISGPTLFTDGDASSWTYKTGFGPPTSPSDANLASLGTYLNTSGQNLIAASPSLSPGVEDGQAIDPLTAVTAMTSSTLVASATGTTTFTYPAGTIGHDTSASGGGEQLGSIWSGISHALHDALQWLQNVSADVYKDLQEGAVAVEMAADSITCTVSADIMKAVNGVDQALEEVVSTVEEYANVLVNLIVTIVEQSFLYKLIAEIIALISLFYHLKDIQDLSNSLYSTFSGLGPLPTGSSWNAYGSDYIGTDNALTNATAVNGGASNVPDELVTGLLDAIFGNPFTKKILNKVMAYLSQFLGGLLPAPPIGFQLPTSLADDFIADVETLEQILIDDVVDLVQDAMTDLMNMLVADMEDPQATYTNLKDTLASLANEISTDVEQVFDWVDTVIAGAVSDAQTAIGTNTYISLTIPGLADLCKLFGIGDTSGDTLNLQARDAVFFPMALVVWVAVYMSDGTSISSVSDLSSTTATPGDALDGGETRWTVARLAVDGAMTELGGDVWSVSKFVDGDKNPAAGPFISAAGAWCNLIRWTNDLVYTVENVDPKLPDALYLGVRTYFAVVTAVLTLPGQGFNPGEGWPDDPKRTDVVNLINAVLTIAIMGYDTYEVATSSPSANQIVGVIGQDLSRTQPLATTIYDVTQGDDPPTEATLAWALYVGIVPAVGWVLQGMAAGGEFDETPTLPPGTDNPRRQGPPPGRPRRRNQEDPPGRARRRRPNG